MPASFAPGESLEPGLQPEKFYLILVLFFCSGLLALVYEVLWMKELGLLFGNTAFAAATTLAAFFAGLAIGGHFWGQRAARLHNPLQTYGLLELAVALSVFGYFQILDAYHALYPSLFEVFGNHRMGFVVVKFLLSMTLLFPAAFFIGGTLPVITQYLVHDPEWLGLKVSILYAVNTLGAALGSLLAGFFLPVWFGFSLSYGLAIGATTSIGGMALVLSRRWPAVRSAAASPVSKAAVYAGEPLIPLSTIRALALVSGFGTLALQVFWTRMFAQVLQNSVYTFATILLIFLLALSAGAALANRLMKSPLNPFGTVFGLFTLGALLAAATPFLFHTWTDGMQYIGGDEGWAGYLIQVLKMEVAIMGLPVLVLGALFPYLLKLAEAYFSGSGRLVGQFVALNTAGSIAGSLIAGFVIIPAVGTWAGIRLTGVIYLLAALYLLYRNPNETRPVFAIPMIGIVLLVSVLDTSRLPRVRIDPVDEEESLLDVRESSSGTVAVVRVRDSLRIKVNNHYTLGGTGSRELEEVEGYLPVLLHRKPGSVFFVGMGTGISAGAVLYFPIQRLVVAELIPEVVEASGNYFTRFNNRLFFDPRVEVIQEDGRNVLAGSLEQFDLIIADLFIPWRSGAGSLYSLEHFRAVRERLSEHGLFMQWLPAYQLSRAEFGTIVRTLLKAFPQVTLWRGDFSSRKPILGLLAQPEREPLTADASLLATQRLPKFGEGVPILARYVGNLGVLADEWSRYPVNSDDRPFIEYQAPITQRRQKKREVEWMTGEPLIRLMEQIQARQPPLKDPYLELIPPDLRVLSEAGMALHRSKVLRQQGRLSAAQKASQQYKDLVGGKGPKLR